MSLYCLSWDYNRMERLDASDAATNVVLATQTISNFEQGVYVRFVVSGSVKITVTNLRRAATLLWAVCSSTRPRPAAAVPGVSGS